MHPTGMHSCLLHVVTVVMGFSDRLRSLHSAMITLNIIPHFVVLEKQNFLIKCRLA